MLNELQQLRNSLKQNHIQAAVWHPAIKPLAKYTTLLVRLNEQGIPASVGELPRDQAAKLRNIQPDNQNSFPAFNLNCPVFQVSATMDLWEPAITAPADAVQTLPLAYEGRNGKVPALDRLRRLLREYPAQEIGPKLAASSDDSVQSTIHLLHLLKAGNQSPEQFVRSFAQALILASRRGDIGSNLAVDVLFGKLSKKGTREPWQCILFLDLEDINPFQTAVASADSAAAWSEAMLLPADESSGAAEELVQCALDGNSGPAIGDKMPNPNLPLLGGTYLFSMNAEIPCQNRYGQSSTSLFPVTRGAVQGLNDALLHMTAKDAEGKTWSRVPSGTGDKLDLLIAYIEEAPQIDAPIAGTLAVGSAEEDDEEEEEGDANARKRAQSSGQMSYFVQRLNRVHKAVELEAGPAIRGGHLRLFVLSTIDKGRKQVLFDARYEVGRFAEARDLWVAGAENAPALELQFFQGKGKQKKKWRGVRAPSPVEVAYSFRTLWIRNAERSEKVSGVSLGRLYKLLLDPDRNEAAFLLERFLPLKVDLMIAAGKPARNEKTGEVFAYTGAALSAPALYDLRTSAATLGILLRLLGRVKETYMNERDYLLGQLLQFADRLHIVYCHGVRGGQVPPQLIGNSLMDQAGQNPAKALAILQQRLPVYERYATQLLNSTEPAVYGADDKREEARLGRLKHKAWEQAGWIKATLAKLCQEVHCLGLDPTAGPQGQAELLLGYLAAPAKKDDN